MERYLMTVGWVGQHVEQVRVAGSCGLEAACVAIDQLREKHGDRLAQTNGGEDFRATEVQQITRRPSAPKKMPKERRGLKGKDTEWGKGQGH